VRACGGLFRSNQITYPVHVFRDGPSSTGTAAAGSLPHSASLQEQAVQDSGFQASEIKTGPRSPKDSSAPHMPGVQRGYVEETSSE